MVCVEQWEYLLSEKMFGAQRVLDTLISKKQKKKEEERDFSVIVCI